MTRNQYPPWVPWLALAAGLTLAVALGLSIDPDLAPQASEVNPLIPPGAWPAMFGIGAPLIAAAVVFAYLYLT